MFSRQLGSKDNELLMTLVMALLYGFGVIYIVSESVDQAGFFLPVILGLGILLPVSVRHYLYQKNLDARNIILATSIFQIAMISLTQLLLESNSIELLYIILILESSIIYTDAFGFMYSVIGFVFYYAVLIYNGSFDTISEGLQSFIVALAIFFMVIWIIYLLKVYNRKDKALKDLLVEFNRTKAQLKELAALKERQRIAGEMHDIVGHTLASTIVELEASKLLFDKDPDQALAKMTSASDNIKLGLNELRQAVRKLETEGISFKRQLQLLIQDMKEHTDINIELDMEDIELMSVQQNGLYLSVKESLTNSMKHGNATDILISINLIQKHLVMSISDNGKGVQDISQGYGLNKMESRIIGLAGTIQFSSKENEGFTTTIRIPVE